MPPVNRITLQHLVHLEALVQEGHVTRAAERVGIGQPAMSSSLAKLRLLFKDPLLVKTSRGMEPTARALALAKQARWMMELLEGHSGTLEAFDPLTAETCFRIVASDGIARVMLPELLQIAQKAAPRMRFTVSFADPRRAAEHLRDGDFDLVISFIRHPPDELRQGFLYAQKLVCIARRDHDDINGRLSLKQFAAQPHAVWGAPPAPYFTMERMVDEAMEARGTSRQIALRVQSVLLLPEIVAKTNLLAVIPRPLALASSQTMPLQILPLPFKVDSVDISMLWHDRLHQDPAHKWLRRTLRGIGKTVSAGRGADTSP